VQLMLSDDGGVTFPHSLVGNIVATTKKADFTAPTLLPNANTARIRVAWSANPAVQGTTPINFRAGPSSITVTQPNVASDVWTVGGTATILWANNLSATENVKIELSTDGGGTFPIILAASTPSDGSHSVQVLGAWTTTSARVRITWLRSGLVSDVSAQNFVIQ
jgi:hypothetical protein